MAEIELKGQATVTFDQKSIDILLKGRSGPVVLHTANIGRALNAEAKKLCPVSDGKSGSGKPKTTIRLRDSIGWEMFRGPDGWEARLFATAEHALSTLLGAKPHPIYGFPFLYFFWDRRKDDRGPGFVLMPEVRHPGNQPFNFFEDAARNVGLEVDKTTERR